MKTESRRGTTQPKGVRLDWRRAFALVAALVLVVGCAEGEVDQKDPKLVTIQDIDALKTAFVEGAGSVRLILLLSPT